MHISMKTAAFLVAFLSINTSSIAQTSNVAETLQQFGLSGEWAASCSSISAENPHYAFALIGKEAATYYVSGGRDGQPLVVSIIKAVVIGDDTLVFELGFDKATQTQTIKKIGNKIRTLDSRMSDGRIFTQNGKRSTGPETPLLEHCVKPSFAWNTAVPNAATAPPVQTADARAGCSSDRPGNSNGQSGPSLCETVQFINDYYKSCATQSSEAQIMFRTWYNAINRSIFVDGPKISVSQTAHSNIFFDDPMSGRRAVELDSLSRVTGIATLPDLQANVIVEGANLTLRCAASKPNCWASEFKTLSNSAPDMAPRFVLFGSRPPEHSTSIVLGACEMDGAQRLGRAFEHLILLSGGKKSLF